MVGWQKAGTAVIGYRIITSEGAMIYDGRVRFTGTGPFEPAVTMVEGPFVAKVTPRGAVIWFTLSRPASCSVTVGPRTSRAPAARCARNCSSTASRRPRTTPTPCATTPSSERYGFRTAPRAGARVPFTFSYSSDSRGGQGGGDRNFNGPNAYIMRRSVALARQRNIAFMLFTGDLVGGPHRRRRP